jgi:hypothetical protein
VVRSVEAPASLSTFGDESARSQDLEVLGDRRGSRGELRRDLAGGQHVASDEADDLAAVRFGNGTQGGFTSRPD